MEFIKNTLLPRHANVYHPYALRPVAITVMLFMLVVVQMIFNMQAAQPRVLGFATDITVADVLDVTNQQRRTYGVESLAINDNLQRAAERKADDMFTDDYWAHNAPDGTEPWEFIKDSGYSYIYAGENLAKNFRTSSGVVNGWMNSEGHRENLLNENYNEVGFAVKNGVLNGEETTLVVAMYGQQLQVAGSEEVTPPATVTSAPDSARQPASLNPLQTSATMTWAMKAAVPVLALLSMLYIGQHLILRRQHLAWDHHVHPRPLLQAGVLMSVVVVMFISSYGVVG